MPQTVAKRTTQRPPLTRGLLSAAKLGERKFNSKCLKSLPPPFGHLPHQREAGTATIKKPFTQKNPPLLEREAGETLFS